MKLLLALLALFVGSAHATPSYVVYHAPEGYQATLVGIHALPDTAVFGQFTLEWDSADTSLGTIGILVGGFTFTTFEPCCSEQEYGDSRILVQWVKVPGTPGLAPENHPTLIPLFYIYQYNFCGWLHLHEGVEELGNPLTHFITQGPLTMWSARDGNLGTVDGPQCLVGSTAPTWSRIKGLYR